MADEAIKGVGQKIKGKVQQFTGDVKMETNHPISGTVDKIKGKANDLMGDMNIKKEENRSDIQ
jgi:uncharacterized protein YjbJ (UPF0337 family)